MKYEWTDPPSGAVLALELIPGEDSEVPISFTADGLPCDPAEWGLEYAAELLRVVTKKEES